MNSQENRDLLVEIRTQNTDILRRLGKYDEIIVPRIEYDTFIRQIQANIADNQNSIKSVEEQIRGIIWKVGGGLATLQVITSIVLYLLAKG